MMYMKLKNPKIKYEFVVIIENNKLCTTWVAE